MKKEHPYRHEGMHKGAPADNFRRAEDLREKMTAAESVLWERLKDNQLGVKFRRQHPVQLYIVDFYCHRYRFVIEVDGDYHDLKEQVLKDLERISDLKLVGLEIMRFRNEEVLGNLDFVLNSIQEKLDLFKNRIY